MSEITVDGKKLTEEEFEQLKTNPNIRIKKLEEEDSDSYKTLQKLNG